MPFTNRQIEIIEAATQLIGKNGVHSLTTKSLAKEMGFSEPALYRHFKNKVDILNSVLQYFKSNIGDYILPILSADTTGIEKMKNLIDFQFSHFKKNPAIVMVIFSETSFQDNEMLSHTVLNIMTQKQTLIESIIKFGQLDNSIRNDIKEDQLATIIMGSMRIHILKWRLSNYSFDLVDEGQKLWNTIQLIIKK